MRFYKRKKQSVKESEFGLKSIRWAIFLIFASALALAGIIWMKGRLEKKWGTTGTGSATGSPTATGTAEPATAPPRSDR